MNKDILLLGGAAALLYLITGKKDNPTSTSGTPSESNFTFAGIPPKTDGGNYIARVVQTNVPAPTIKSPEGGDLKIPVVVATAGTTFTQPVVASSSIGYNSTLKTSEVNTNYSSARLSPSGIIPSGDFNYKVTTATTPTQTLKVVENFSSKGYDAFGTGLPQGTIQTAANVFGSKGNEGFIPVVENGTTNWYSPKTFARTFGRSK